MLPVVVKFFLLPIYAQKLDTGEFGILSLLYLVSAMFVFSNFRIQLAIQTFYYDYNHNRKQLKEYISNILSFSFLLTFTFVLLSIFFGPLLFDLIFKSGQITFFPNGFLAILIAFCTLNMTAYFAFLKNEKKYIELAFYSLGQTVFRLVFLLAFLFGTNWGLTAILTGEFIGVALVLFYFLWNKRDYLTLRLQKSLIFPSLKYSILLLPFFLINWSAYRVDRFVIERMLDVSWVGKYAVLVAITGLIRTVMMSSITGFRPFFFELYKKGAAENAKEIKILERVFILLSILATSGVILLGCNLDLFIKNEEYLEIVYLIPLAAMVPLTFAWSILLSQALIFAKKAAKVSRVSWISFALVILLYYLWIPEFKLEGVLFANIIGNIIMAILYFYYGQKEFPIRHDYKIIVSIPLAFILMLFSLSYFWEGNGYSINIFGIIQFLLTLFLLFILFKKDILIFVASIQKKYKK